MKDINKLKNYRLKYKRYYDIDFTSEYQIHHIDQNRNNNDIENLLLLPKELYQKYHFYLNVLAPYINGNSLNIDISINKFMGVTYTQDMVRGLLETMNECQKWVAYKAQLDFKKQFEE